MVTIYVYMVGVHIYCILLQRQYKRVKYTKLALIYFPTSAFYLRRLRQRLLQTSESSYKRVNKSSLLFPTSVVELGRQPNIQSLLCFTKLLPFGKVNGFPLLSLNRSFDIFPNECILSLSFTTKLSTNEPNIQCCSPLFPAKCERKSTPKVAVKRAQCELVHKLHSE